MNPKIIIITFLTFLISNLSAQVILLQEDFENGSFPDNWSQTTNATDGGWLVGTNTELQSSDFPIVANTQILVTNDDACDCDKSVDYLIFPQLDLSNYSTIFFTADFFYFQLSYQGAQESLSFVYRNNEAESWNVLQAIEPNTIAGSWETRTFDLSEISGSNVQLGIHYNDGAGWTFGCGLDDILVYEPASVEAELTSLDITEYVQIPNTVSISGTNTNLGLETINSLEIMWSDGENEFSETITGINIPTLGSYNFTHSDEFISSAEGNTNITVTIVSVNSTTDSDQSNNSLSHLSSLEQFVNKVPLYEHFTSNTCPPCASFNPGFQTLLDNNQANSSNNKVNTIKYQVNFPGAGDESYNSDVAARVTHYGINGVPSPLIDGISASGNQQELDNASENPGLVRISGEFEVNENEVNINVDVESFVNDVNAKLHIAVVEKEYENMQGTNGEVEFYQVLRKLLPSSNGTPLSLSSGSTESVETSYSFNVGNVTQNTFNLWEGIENCQVIAFVEDNNKTIMQSAFIGNLSNIAETKDINQVKIYPNPANSNATLIFNLINKSKVNLSIINILGEVVSNESFDMSAGNKYINLNINELNNGIYYANLSINNEIVSKKFIITK